MGQSHQGCRHQAELRSSGSLRYAVGHRRARFSVLARPGTDSFAAHDSDAVPGIPARRERRATALVRRRTSPPLPTSRFPSCGAQASRRFRGNAADAWSGKENTGHPPSATDAPDHRADCREDRRLRPSRLATRSAARTHPAGRSAGCITRPVGDGFATVAPRPRAQGCRRRRNPRRSCRLHPATPSTAPATRARRPARTRVPRL